MEFTGERFHPDCLREIWYEHYHRYVFAHGFSADRTVLDLACGEGYGSNLLAENAESVIGVDRSAEAIAHAARTYRRRNLRFVEGDAAAVPLLDGSVNLVVSFETLEHLDAQREMLEEFRRVLSDDGLLLISSPDKRTYSDERDYRNEFHVRELYRSELEALLGSVFPTFRLFGQKLAFHSLIWEPDTQDGRFVSDAVGRDEDKPAAWAPDPLYWIGLCGNSAGALDGLDLPELSLFADREESVYAHYEHEIRKNMAAGRILEERDRRIAELEEALNRDSRPQRSWLHRLVKRQK